jgi:D-alanyl-lipoteichoic acid acyltransferase DltB (MBOAT superfamily)
MLFNSYIFIFLFLPATIIGFFAIASTGRRQMALAYLVAASLFFYAWWNPVYIILILLSIIFNYLMGMEIGKDTRKSSAKRILILGILANLLLLGYYKYANFFVDNINLFVHSGIRMDNIILPIGISFFTFTQIAFLLDAYRGETREYNFFHYCLFVTFYPHLLAGPIVHHKELIPQFRKKSIYFFNYRFLSIGLTVFVIGLFKKVVIADTVATYSTPVFAAAATGSLITFFEAWTAALAYTFQIYFDFSGYSDMAIGLSYMFGIKLPFNFNSPYKSINIVEFWRCWHMTLSRFLRDYLYIPLGGNRKGKIRRYVNLFVTMLLGGLWHGAGWTFVIWGALHGFYLIVNHGWDVFKSRFGFAASSNAWKWPARLLTFLAVVFAWVFFRAENFNTAIVFLKGMCGLNGVYLPEGYLHKLGFFGKFLSDSGVKFIDPKFYFGLPACGLLFILLLVVWFIPNTQQMLFRHKIGLDIHHKIEVSSFWRPFTWSPNIYWTIIIFIISIISLVMISDTNEFLYFQF